MIKRGNPDKKYVDSATRVKLIRKGNELFSNENIIAAEKIFVAVDYKDGLVRLGDYYFENKDLVKSCEMYFKSENISKINSFLENSAKVIEKLLKEDNNDIVDKIIIEK
jgi:hypothetical protein